MRRAGSLQRMWQLRMTNTAKEWGVVGTFESVMAAARRIRELEGNQAHGLFFEIFVECDFGTDDEHFRVRHHTGKRVHYGIRRSRPN